MAFPHLTLVQLVPHRRSLCNSVVNVIHLLGEAKTFLYWRRKKSSLHLKGNFYTFYVDVRSVLMVNLANESNKVKSMYWREKLSRQCLHVLAAFLQPYLYKREYTAGSYESAKTLWNVSSSITSSELIFRASIFAVRSVASLRYNRREQGSFAFERHLGHAPLATHRRRLEIQAERHYGKTRTTDSAAASFELTITRNKN